MQDGVNEKLTEEISRILAELTRTIKVVSVYPDNNPLPAKLKETFIERFTSLISENKGLSFKINSGEILYENKSVYKDRPPDDNLARFFHDAGITEISFSLAFEFKEGCEFFKVLKAFMNREEGEDLIGLFWQSNIQGFEYTTLEDVMLGQYDEEYIAQERLSDSDALVLGDHSESGKIQYAKIFLDDEEEQVDNEVFDGDADPESTSPMTPEQLANKEMGLVPVPAKSETSLPDTALILNESYQLAESEFNRVQNILEEDAEFNFCDTVVELVREMLLQETEYPGFRESMTIAERIHSELIHLGKVSYAGHLMATLKELDSMLGQKSVKWKERIHESLVIAGGWENLSRLSSALNGNHEIPPQDIKNYLANFNWEALSAIMDMLGELEYREHRLAIVDYLSTTGVNHIDIIAKGIYDRRWYVVRNTACILGRIGDEKAISLLGRAIEHEEPRVRLEVLKGITLNEEIKDVSLLFKLVWDETLLIRKEVLRVVLNSTSEARLKIIVNIINDSRFISLEQTDQEKLVMAYSLLAGEHSVNFLKRLISGLKSANNELKGFYQKLAFRALTINRSEKAEKTLKDLSRSWKGTVRNLALKHLNNDRKIWRRAAVSVLNQNMDRLEIAGADERAFINLFFILFRTAQLMDRVNASYMTQSSKFYVSFRKLIDERGKISIKVIDGRILVGDRLVKFDSDGMARARDIIDKWTMLGIGGLILDDSLDNGQLDQFIYYIAEFKGSGGMQERENIAAQLSQLGIEGVKLLSVETLENQERLSEDKRLMMRRMARVTFFRAINVVEDAMMCAVQKKEMDISRTKRVVHSLIDRVSEDESSLIELTNIRDFDQYTYAHCVNVCVYSLTLGVKLGLDRKRLSQLGFAAMFHDIGKVRLPEDLIRKPDTFDENDWLQMQQHPHLGAKTILRNLRFGEHSARAARVAFEHHLNSDFTGYPKLKRKMPINLFSKIAIIADTFDALTSGRVYIKKEIPPDEVLRKMMYQMTVKFDSFLMKLFVNIIGIYPPGTLVMLSSDELAVVSQTNQNNLTRPIVRIVGNRSGSFSKFIEADLSCPPNDKKEIVRIIDPKKYNIDIKNIILSDSIGT